MSSPRSKASEQAASDLILEQALADFEAEIAKENEAKKAERTSAPAQTKKPANKLHGYFNKPRPEKEKEEEKKHQQPATEQKQSVPVMSPEAIPNFEEMCKMYKNPQYQAMMRSLGVNVDFSKMLEDPAFVNQMKQMHSQLTSNPMMLQMMQQQFAQQFTKGQQGQARAQEQTEQKGTVAAPDTQQTMKMLQSVIAAKNAKAEKKSNAITPGAQKGLDKISSGLQFFSGLFVLPEIASPVVAHLPDGLIGQSVRSYLGSWCPDNMLGDAASWVSSSYLGRAVGALNGIAGHLVYRAPVYAAAGAALTGTMVLASKLGKSRWNHGSQRAARISTLFARTMTTGHVHAEQKSEAHVAAPGGPGKSKI